MHCPSCGKAMKVSGEDAVGGLRFLCRCKARATYHADSARIDLDSPLDSVEAQPASFTAGIKDDLLKTAVKTYRSDRLGDVTVPGEEADFEAVAKRLGANGIEAEVHASGGGIDVIRVPVGGFVMYFGTAGEVWGASVYRTGNDGDEIGDPVDDIWTDVSSDNTDTNTVAAGIAGAVVRYERQHPGVSEAQRGYTTEVEGDSIVVRRTSDGATIRLTLPELSEAAIELAKKQPKWSWG